MATVVSRYTQAWVGGRPSCRRLPSDLNQLPPALNKFMSGVAALEGISLEDWSQPGPTM